MYKAERYNEDLLQHEVECLHQILGRVESKEAFCAAHELVKRNRITARAKAILRATENFNLKPFHFLINKN